MEKKILLCIATMGTIFTAISMDLGTESRRCTLFQAITSNDIATARNLITTYMNTDADEHDKIDPNSCLQTPPSLVPTTFLQCATEAKNRELVELLIEHGAWPNWHRNPNFKPYEIANRIGAYELIDLFLIYENFAHFILDCHHDDVRKVDIFLIQGLNPRAHWYDEKNQQDTTLAQLARKRGLTGIAAYLENVHQAKIDALKKYALQKKSCSCI